MLCSGVYRTYLDIHPLDDQLDVRKYTTIPSFG